MKTITKRLLFLSLISIITIKTENNTEINAIKEQLDRIEKQKQEKKAAKEQKQKEQARKREIADTTDKGVFVGLAAAATAAVMLGIIKYFGNLKSDIHDLKSQIEYLRKYDIDSVKHAIKLAQEGVSFDLSLLEIKLFNRIVNHLINK